jgi:NodT family efflux transporter outer membrane factor (OMF) lipoprotein
MRIFIVAISCLALAGCMLGPNFHTPTVPQTKRYTAAPLPAKTSATPSARSAGNAQYFAAGRDVPREWWKLFRSEPLDALICMGLANSPNLQAAKAALRQAQETWRAQFGALLLPAIDGQFSGTRQHTTTVSNGINAPNSGASAVATPFNVFNSSFNFSYVLDVFGSSRRELEALSAQIDYQQFQLEAAYLSLTTNIVTTSINIASLQAQIKATQEIILSQESQLSIVKKQLALGAAAGADVLAQETQVAQTRALLPPLQQNLTKSRDALAVLIGQFPSEINLPKFNLDSFTLPANLPISLPSCLTRQRPDIRAQEALLHAASAKIGVATANLFPQVTLRGNYGWTGETLANLFTPTNLVWNYSAALLQPIFRGGSLLAQRRAAIAAYEQAAALYRQTVLQAFQNVADSLEALKYDAQALATQQSAETSARQCLTITEKQYKLGGVSYLSLLNAQRQYQQACINRIQAQATRLADTAALFQALGGGWGNRATISYRSFSK